MNQNSDLIEIIHKCVVALHQHICDGSFKPLPHHTEFLRMRGWQPIETAPKDGTAVLVCSAIDENGERLSPEDFMAFCQVAAWLSKPFSETWTIYSNLAYDPDVHFTPTHWMPLPEMPVLISKEVDHATSPR